MHKKRLMAKPIGAKGSAAEVGREKWGGKNCGKAAPAALFFAYLVSTKV